MKGDLLVLSGLAGLVSILISVLIFGIKPRNKRLFSLVAIGIFIFLNVLSYTIILPRYNAYLDAEYAKQDAKNEAILRSMGKITQIPTGKAKPTAIPNDNSMFDDEARVSKDKLLAEYKERDMRLLQRLKAKEYALLDEEVNQLIKAYQRDYLLERQLDLAFDAFYRADPDLEPMLSAWVSAFPDSAASYMARGVFYSGMGWAKRGTLYIDDTSKEQLDGMQYFFIKAFADFEKAKTLDSKLVHADCYQMEMLMSFGDGESIRALKNHALSVNPYSLTARWYFISSILPRWGGSMAQVEQEIALAKPYYEKNPSLKILDGRVSAELGDQASMVKDYDAALRHFKDALQYGEHWFYQYRIGEIYFHREDVEQASVDLVKAIQLRPNYTQAYYWLGLSHASMGNAQAAIIDFTEVIAANPQKASSWGARGYYYTEVTEYAEALEDYKKALELDPGNEEYRSSIKLAEAYAKSQPAE